MWFVKSSHSSYFLSSCLISSIQRDRLSIQLHCTSRKLDVGDYPARLEEKSSGVKKKIELNNIN